MALWNCGTVGPPLWLILPIILSNSIKPDRGHDSDVASGHPRFASRGTDCCDLIRDNGRFLSGIFFLEEGGEGIKLASGQE